MTRRISFNKKVLGAPAGLALLPVVLLGCAGPAYKAGTYTATGNGYGGAVKVETDFNAKSILAVRVVEEHETKEFAAPAIRALTKKIVEAQTYDVDTVSAATLTSDAIKDAVKDCMEQAAH